MSRSLLRVIGFVFAVCAWPLSAAAQDDAFKRGMEARGDKKWADVIRHMQNAVKADPQESSRKVLSGFLGVNGQEYLPHFFLGEAYFNLQDCGAAVTELSISEQQSGIKSRPDLQGPGQVVVVHVRLEHVADAEPAGVGLGQEAPGVALRIHHDRLVAGRQRVAVVAEPRGDEEPVVHDPWDMHDAGPWPGQRDLTGRPAPWTIAVAWSP